MTDEEYTLWSAHHGKRFGMASALDVALFAAWKPLLLEYHLAELTEATDHIATDRPQRSQQVSLLRQRVHSKRFAQDRAAIDEAEANAERDVCRDCNGCGMIFVPHLKGIVDGRWIHPHSEMTVACMCNAGVNKWNKTNAYLTEKMRQYRMIDLHHYEGVLLAQGLIWRQLIVDRKAKHKAEQAASWRAREADRAEPIKAYQETEPAEELEDAPF